MEWLVARRIPLQEVQARLRAYQDKYGSLSHLHEEYSKGRIPPGVFQEYIEWTNMSHALRAYQEGEDFEYVADESLELSPEEARCLTHTRLELLDFLSREKVNSINELAHRLGRNVKNVYQDLRALEALGLLALNREGNRSVPEPLVSEISIRFS